MECESMLFVKNHVPYLWDLSNSFSNSFIDFYSCEGVHLVIYQKEWSVKLGIDNDGWHETLNLLCVSRCKMLHFVMSYMKQNKSGKQTLESAQYGLEIRFKFPALAMPNEVDHVMKEWWRMTSLQEYLKSFCFYFACLTTALLRQLHFVCFLSRKTLHHYWNNSHLN